MKKAVSVRLNELIQQVKKWIRRKDDDDWFNHPFAVF